MLTRFAPAMVVLSLTATATPSGPNAADTAAIRSFLTRVYNSYHECIVRPGARESAAVCVDPVSWESVFTPDTKRLIDRDSPAGEATAANDADPICGCQDYGTYRVTAIALAGQPDGRVRARVAWTETFRSQPAARRNRTLILQKTPAGWRVHDALEASGDSYRRAIIDELRPSPHR